MRNSDIKIDNLAFDIEELTVMGKNKSFCPYYYSKEFAKDADLIFMPYNYILDKKVFPPFNKSATLMGFM